MMESHSAKSAAVSTCHSEAALQLAVKRQPFIWAESIVCSELLFRISDVARRGRARADACAACKSACVFALTVNLSSSD